MVFIAIQGCASDVTELTYKDMGLNGDCNAQAVFKKRSIEIFKRK